MTGQTAAAAVFGLKRGSGWFLTAGILFIVVGGLALVEPLFTSVAVGLFLGIGFILAGAAAVGTGLANRRHKGGWLYVILGVFGLLVGASLAMQPVAAAVSLVWIVGVWLIFAGGFELAAAFRATKNRVWMVAIGVFDVVLGVLLIDVDPITALHFLAFVVALSFMVRGVASIVYSRAILKHSVPAGSRLA